jgi:ATP synthase protein I
MTRPPAIAEPEDDEPAFTPLTAEQARHLREQIPQVSPWWIVGGQVVVGLLAACVAWASSENQGLGWSLLYGALAVAVPAGFYARALARGAGASFLLWELVKIGMTVGLLAAAPKVVPGLSWLAMLAGVTLATKMYWVALACVRRPRQTEN